MSACVVPAMRALRAATRPNSSDRSLVSCAQEGDQEAFAALFEMHKRRVYSLCLLTTGDVAAAEDLTQEVFIQVFRKIRTFRGDAAFSTWLHRVAVNTVLMSRRKRTPPQMSLDDSVYVGSTLLQRNLAWNDPELSGAPERIALLQGIKQLPEGCRRIFILHEVEGYEHEEIAKLLNCSTGNSKSQLHKARMKLRELLFPEGGQRLQRRPVRFTRGQRNKQCSTIQSALRRAAIDFGSHRNACGSRRY